MGEIRKLLSISIFFAKTVILGIFGNKEALKYLTKVYVEICLSSDIKVSVPVTQKNNGIKSQEQTIKRVKLHELYPGIEKQFVTIHSQAVNFQSINYNRDSGSLISPNEMLILTTLVAYLKPKKIYEMGTYHGISTYNFFLNANGAEILTVDREKCVSLSPAVNDFREKRPDIFIQGDTQSFYPPSLEGVNFVFIDADHSYEGVKNDTLKVLDYVADEGLILWHDFNPDHPGVFDFISLLHKYINVCVFHQSNIAFFQVPKNFDRENLKKKILSN